MQKIIPKHYAGDPHHPIYWEDEERKRNYRRIWGGLAWPQTLLGRPGFAVIVGEEFDDRGPNRVPDKEDVLMHVLAEGESADFDEFMAKCAEFARLAQKNWYGSPFDMAIRQHLIQFNQGGRAAGRSSFWTYTAPLIGHDGDLTGIFEYGVVRIRGRLQKGALNLDSGPRIKACLQHIPPDPTRFESYPPLVALCFAVGALDYYQYIHPMAGSKPGKAETEYDPFE
ncbi:MAG: hypothetical protein WAN11_04285 [Syntrophobacteraceae bacterium]